MVVEHKVDPEREVKGVHGSSPVFVERRFERGNGDPLAAARTRQHRVTVGRWQMAHVRRLVLESAAARAAPSLGLLGSRWLEDLHGFLVRLAIPTGRPQRIQRLRFAGDRAAWG